jgi:hypothetical protein
MKAFIKNILLFMMPLVMLGGLISGCEKEDITNGGNPVIHYIRVTDPAASDSLLVGSSLGRLIAVVGENLENTRELWFNDQQAALNPAFITSQSILVTVPSLPPSDVTNKMILKFANGSELQHDFEVQISAPQIDRIQSEHVPDGDELVLQGEYFFQPMKVTFSDGTEAEIASVTQNEVRVKVPAEVESGPVTVQTNFGKATTKQWFRDNRNIFADMEGSDYSGWWHGPNYIVENDPNIKSIGGKFIRINQNLDAGQWFEFMVANPPGTMPTQNIPDDAIRNPANYNLKFEINTLSAFIEGTSVRMYIGNDMPGERNDKNYTWTPVLDTKGKWQTITIPFEHIIGASSAKVSANGYGVSFWFWGGVEMKADFAVDNFRVTPK